MAVQKVITRPGGGVTSDAGAVLTSVRYRGPAANLYVHLAVFMSAGWDAGRTVNTQEVMESRWTLVPVPASVDFIDVPLSVPMGFAELLNSDQYVGPADGVILFSTTNPDTVGMTLIGTLIQNHVYDIVQAPTGGGAQQVTSATLTFS